VVTNTCTLADIPLDPLVWVDADTSLADTARVLKEGGSDAVLVATDPPTEFTESDVVAAIADGVAPATPIGSLARSRPLAIPIDTRVDELLDLMAGAGRRTLVVTDPAGRPVGTVTIATAIAVVVAGPPWLGALRIALQIERGAP
jgi:predicted transcriptional regulator